MKCVVHVFCLSAPLQGKNHICATHHLVRCISLWVTYQDLNSGGQGDGSPSTPGRGALPLTSLAQSGAPAPQDRQWKPGGHLAQPTFPKATGGPDTSKPAYPHGPLPQAPCSSTLIKALMVHRVMVQCLALAWHSRPPIINPQSSSSSLVCNTTGGESLNSGSDRKDGWSSTLCQVGPHAPWGPDSSCLSHQRYFTDTPCRGDHWAEGCTSALGVFFTLYVIWRTSL